MSEPAGLPAVKERLQSLTVKRTLVLNVEDDESDVRVNKSLAVNVFTTWSQSAATILRGRIVASRQSRSSTSRKSLKTSQNVLERLFPGLSAEHLDNLSRDELVNLISSGSSQPFSGSSEVGQSTPETAPEPDPEITMLLGFEGSRIQEFIWDESSDGANQHQAGIDDVNGITALFDNDSGRSYLGISSVSAILQAMAYPSPHLRQAIQNNKESSLVPNELPPIDMPPLLSQTVCPSSNLQILDEATLIDAYFQSVHPIIPMVDEADFRQCYAHGGRMDLARGPWLALLKMVLTFGYISCNDDSQAGHTYFANRASEHMHISCLGVGHLYMLQALILYGGYFLHFVNKPNMATSVMGAAHRMALAMGLHQQTPSDKIASIGGQRMVQMRTRTWWCLFCLDTWTGTTLGRPPSHASGSPSLNEPSILRRGGLDYNAISMNASASFSLIAARIQERMTGSPLIPPCQVKKFDDELLSWHDQLHPAFRADRKPPGEVCLAALLLEYRYLNTQMILHRPYLLVQAIKANDGLENQDTISSANICCEVAKQTVDMIARNWYPNQILAWNASWFLFQACLVLLLRLLSPFTSPSEIGQLEDAITQSLSLFADMRPWRDALCQGHDLILFIYSPRNTGNQEWDSSWLLSDDDLVNSLGISAFLEDWL
ncbi:hypothetical protein F53441_9699 [Fusarium austroafricanum]|uniref:Xylanolytic transcriptional activator regulatory domain-containing protein n=1 Tax=Fusarium austroafricanum TaxID=2364996 RepID=A0A8H4NV87_9HYPO|nr:hypothetical protein F53441_9699 [Fusarium austroafricanum]